MIMTRSERSSCRSAVKDDGFRRPQAHAGGRAGLPGLRREPEQPRGVLSGARTGRTGGNGWTAR